MEKIRGPSLLKRLERTVLPFKICTGCKESKPLSAFYSYIDKRFGTKYYHSQCAKCKNAYGRKRYLDNKEVHNERGRRWYERNKERVRAAARARPDRDYHAKKLRAYGINVDAYESLLTLQGRACAICRQLPNGKRVERLSVDHDHKTGAVRGLLCRRCNSALGLFHDSVEWLQRAMDYLKGDAPCQSLPVNADG